ncbi:MAG: cyclopropane-fatty-acyl-phospholipid synthase family protein [Burkholderiaceae bacterium]
MLAAPLARLLDHVSLRHPIPARIVLWDGTDVPLGPDPRVAIRLRDPKAVRYFMPPSLDALGDAYVDGAIDIDGAARDAIAVVAELASQGTASMVGKLPHWARRHTRQSDRQAIAYHYDVSNAFYQKFLDSRMVYSCAYFRHDDDDLEAAQLAKLDHVCRKLRLRPGMRLLDIGCGWGALVIHAAGRYGCKAVGVTLSENQRDLAIERVAAAGLADRVEIRLQHYLDIPREQPFDRIASIGMFEHVGLKHLGEYFKRIGELLRPGGMALNHGITSADPDSRSVGLGGGDFIGRHVFPDGELPHVALAITELSRGGLELVDAESLRRHYGRTLWAWSDRFEENLDALGELAGEQRMRIWRAYLAGCAHAFDQGWINIYQLLVGRPVHRGRLLDIDHPMTRDYQYVDD